MQDLDVARWRLRTQHLVRPFAGSAGKVTSSLLAVQAENASQSAWAVSWTWNPASPSSSLLRMTWLPAGFEHPVRVPVTDGYHLRPIAAADVDLDYLAVMGSRERLWSVFGEAWGWPAADMTYQEDREDLARHEAEIAAHGSFNYALFDEAETALLGCVYVDPPEKAGADAEISWWVVDGQVGTGLQDALDDRVPQWIAAAWPFRQPRYIGRDLTWSAWLALPDL